VVATATMGAPLLISLLVASAAALAQPAGFPALDRNGDGYLSRVEALAARVKAALSAERGIRAGAIAVETYEGRVQLSGFVSCRTWRHAPGVSPPA
jgi:hypothetical protein